MKLWTINLALLVIVGSAPAFAQSQRTEDDGCNRFKMRVRQAPEALDQSMLMAETDGQKQARGKVINPCRNANVPVRGKVRVISEFQMRPTVEQFLKITPSPTPKLKTPSEVLRDLNKPKK